MRMSRKGFEEHEKLQAEIQREKAEALGRAGEQLEEVLMKLVELRNSIEALGGELTNVSRERAALVQGIRYLVQEYNALREKALTYHHYLIIQREAVGLTDHRDVDHLYRVPDPLEDIAGAS